MTIVIKQVGPDVGFFVEELGDQPRGFVRGVTLTVNDILDPMGFMVRHEDKMELVRGEEGNAT